MPIRISHLRRAGFVLIFVVARDAFAQGDSAGFHAGNGTLDSAQRQRVIDAVARDVKEHYADRSLARQMADAVLAHAHGDDAATDGAALARMLTRQLRDVRRDMDLEVVYSAEPIPEQRGKPTPEEQARYRQMLEQQHCFLENVETLPHRIGYMKIDAFPEPAVCVQTARTAMAKLNDADAVIFDLRDNRGGMPEMVALIAAYFFDHPEYWFNPRENTTVRSWTRSPVAGSKIADKPVYVLTSARTISGGEQFCYDLKMLKRATLVGETTAGAAHAGVFYRIDEHFGVGIPEARPINPFGDADWAEVGVAPDVPVKAEDALATAIKLAERRLQTK
jgi:hypothetical protein